ncbi:MAG: PglZ domain-containing protein [archaeon]|nr:PglZ domain-containing protein [archaeon]
MHINIDDIVLNYLRDILGEEIPKPLTALCSYVIKNNFTAQLTELWNKNRRLEEPSLSFWIDIFTSVLFGVELVTARNNEEKTALLFKVIVDSEKYERLRKYSDVKEVCEPTKKIFSINTFLQMCCNDIEFRNNLCALIFGLDCASKFPEDKRKALVPLLFERFAMREIGERQEAQRLYSIIKAELGTVFELPIEQKISQYVEDLVKNNEELWFGTIKTTTDLVLLADECSGALLSEFDFVLRKARELIESGRISSKSDVDGLKTVFHTVSSWCVTKSNERYHVQVQNLSKLVSLIETTVELRSTSPSSWDEWVDIYERKMLPSDKLVSEFRQDPVFWGTETCKIVTKQYEEVRFSLLHHYEMFLIKMYPKWLSDDVRRPKMVMDVMDEVARLLRQNYVVFLLVYDGMRVDFWYVLRERLLRTFDIVREERLLAVIPSTTVFSRRAIFSGSLPQDIHSFSEPLLAARKLGLQQSALRHERGKIEKLLNLIDREEKLRIFVYLLLDEIGHYIQTGLSIALKNFEPIAETHVKFYERVKEQVERHKKVAFIVTSDHGFARTSERREIHFPSGDDWRWLRWWVSPRFAILYCSDRYYLPRSKQIDDLVSMLENQEVGYVVRDLAKLKLVKKSGIVEVVPPGVDTGQREVSNPILIIFPKGENRFFKPPGKEPSEFAHGGLSPYETIVPYAILMFRK